MIIGKIVSGLGEGRYFLSLPHYRSSISRLLFPPYPGTLNIVVDKKQAVLKDRLLKEALYVPGFHKEGKRYGAVYLLPCSIAGRRAAFIFPEINRHPAEVWEIIAPFHIRSAFGKKDGDLLEVEL